MEKCIYHQGSLDATKPEILTEGATPVNLQKRYYNDTPVQKKQKRESRIASKISSVPNIDIELLKKIFLLPPSE